MVARRCDADPGVCAPGEAVATPEVPHGGYGESWGLLTWNAIASVHGIGVAIDGARDRIAEGLVVLGRELEDLVVQRLLDEPEELRDEQRPVVRGDGLVGRHVERLRDLAALHLDAEEVARLGRACAARPGDLELVVRPSVARPPRHRRGQAGLLALAGAGRRGAPDDGGRAGEREQESDGGALRACHDRGYPFEGPAQRGRPGPRPERTSTRRSAFARARIRSSAFRARIAAMRWACGISSTAGGRAV